MPRSAAPLVGRLDELSALRRAVRDAADGTASAVVLGGDAGVGKTRLLSELVASARSDGRCIVVGHCVDLGDTPPPYLPFSEAFTRLAADRPETIEALLDKHPSIARLLPGRAARSADGDDRVERGELFDAVLGALAQLASDAPVVFVIEDLHWADQATHDLTGYLFTRLSTERVAIVASYRSDDLHRRHPLRPTLAEWARLPAVTRVQVDPLSPDDVRKLVRDIAAEGDSTALRETDLDGIVTRADGNAFFAEELVAAAGQYGDARHLPWQLADLLLVRLDRLSDDARRLVRVAAVAGRRVTHPVLTEVVDLPPARLDDAVRDAIDAHILQLTPSGRGYTFRHALLAEAVYDDLLPGERVRLHAAYAAILAGRPDRSAAELARHARASHDLATAYTASVRAGEEAMSVAAPQEALQHYETALEIAPQASSAPPDRSELIVATVEAAEAAGRALRGYKLAKLALADRSADSAADGDPLARARLLYAMVKAALAGEIDEETLGATAEALRLVPAGPSAFRAQMLAVHARVAAIMGNESEAQRAAREAVELGREVGCSIAVTDAQTTLAMLEKRAGDPDEAVRLLRQVVEESRRSGDIASELRSRYSLASLHHELGKLSGALDDFALIYRRAAEVGRPWEVFGMHSRAMAGVLRYTRGDWNGALEVLDVSGEKPPGLAHALFSSAAAIVRAGRGDRAVLRTLPSLRPYWEQEGRVGLNAAFAGLEMYEQDADADAALALIDDLVSTLSTVWLDPWFLARIQLAAQGVAVLCAAAASSTTAARPALAEHGRRLLDDGRTAADKGLPHGRRLGIEGRAWLQRLEAEAARLRWLTDHDAPSADELVTVWQGTVDAFDYGNEAQLARARARLAGVLRASGRGAEAAQQADLARTAARSMGAVALLAQLRELGTSAAPAGPSGGPRGIGALTDRERDVLALLVDARTNRQIAARLYISEKTVSVHVSNILAKLDVRSRNEAAALARRSG